MIEDEENTDVVDAPVVDAPALPDELLVAAPANCTGELVLLPHVDGTTFNEYQCQTCGQIVHVSLEDEIPLEHSPVLL